MDSSPDTATSAFADLAVRRDLGIECVRVEVDGQVASELRWLPDLRRDIFSISKTITSLGVGLAEAEGQLSVDDRALSHLPGFADEATEGAELITVRQLLTMTSGIVYRWDDDADHDGDPVRSILAHPLGTAPGSTFAYRGSNTYLLARILHARTGQDLRDYLVPRLFGPLQIDNPQWLRCPLGHSLGATGLQLRPVELARIGRLLLHQGRLGDRQLVPAGYVDAMITDLVDTAGHVSSRATIPHDDNATYGRGVWRCARDGAWRMDGIYGQFVIVFPRQRACVTITAHYEGPTTDILDAVWESIVPVLA